jgi:hypothetical protein
MCYVHIGLTFAVVGWSPRHPVYCGADGAGDGDVVVAAAGDGVVVAAAGVGGADGRCC